MVTRIGGISYQVSANTSGFSRAMVSTRSDLALTKRLMRDSKPAAETMADGLQRLERLYKSGQIDLRAYRFALDKLNREQREASQSMLGGMMKSFTSINPAIVAATVSLAAFYATLRAGRAVVESVREQMGVLDDLAKSAETLGVSVAALQRLRFAAEQSGVDAGRVDTGFARMIKTISEANQGIGTSVRTLAALNLNVAALNNLSPEKQFREIAEAIRLIPNENDRLRLTMEIFGRSGAEMIRMLNLGKRGLEELGGQIRTFGDEDVQGIEDANDSINRMQHAVIALSQALAIELAPTIENVANKLRRLVEEDSLFEQISQVTEFSNGLLAILPGTATIARMNAKLAKSLAQQTEAIEQQNAGLVTQGQHYASIAAGQAALAQQTAPALTDQQQLVADITARLRDQAATWGLTADQIELYRLRAAGVAPELIKWIAAEQRRQAAMKADDAVVASVSKVTDALKEQIATMGLSADQIELYHLARMGATQEELEAVQALQAQRDQLRDRLPSDQAGTVTIAQGIVRGSAADFERDAKLQLGSQQDPQQEANKQLEKIRQLEEEMLEVNEAIRDREAIEVTEVRF